MNAVLGKTEMYVNISILYGFMEKQNPSTLCCMHILCNGEVVAFGTLCGVTWLNGGICESSSHHSFGSTLIKSDVLETSSSKSISNKTSVAILKQEITSTMEQCQVKKPVLGQNISRGCYFTKTGVMF